MTARIAHFITVLAETKPEEVSQPSLQEIRAQGEKLIEAGLKIHASVQNTTDVKKALNLVNEGYIKMDCYMRRAPEVNVHHPPVFDEVPTAYLPTFVSKNDGMKNDLFKFLENQKRKLGAHLLDDLPINDILNRFDCPKCIGQCRVQSARTSSLKFRKQTWADEPLIVPCVTECSRKLSLFEISDFNYVSSFYILFFMFLIQLRIVYYKIF